MKKSRIALAQIHYFDSGEKHNLEKINKFISLAKKKKADIICFPESCVHKTDILKINNQLLKDIQESCRKNSIWAIISDSFIVKNKPYKMAILIDRNGKIKGKYKKINLYDDYTKEGKRVFVFKTDFAKIGIVICWDLAFSDIFRRMKNLGAQIIFVPAKWCYEDKAHDKDHKKREKELLKSMIMSRAFENLYFIALVNPYASSKDLVSYSAIASPHKILADIQDKEGLVIADVDLREIKKFSKIYPGK